MTAASRAAALSAAVAAVTAHRCHVDLPAAATGADLVTDGALVDALVALGAWQADHAVGGDLVLRIAGQVAAHLGAGGGDV